MCAAGIDWFEIVRTVAPVVTAGIAFVALRNWQRQDKAKREAEFLDSLLDAAHTYIAQMPKPITLLGSTMIGMEAHVPTWEPGNEAEKKLKGAIAYFEKNGERDSKRLFAELETIRPSTVALRSLVAKGQVFSFHDYAKCQNAVRLLLWHFNRIDSFASVIGLGMWNWENPEVRKSLEAVVSLNAAEVEESLKANNVALIEFAIDTYRRIYG